MILASFAAGVVGIALLAGWLDCLVPIGRTAEPVGAGTDGRWSGRHAWRGWLPVVLVTLGAGALRLYHLTYLSLWLDEGGTIQMSRLAWLRVLGLQGAYDTHPPLYYAVVKLFSAVVPEVAAARVLSFVTGTLTVPVLYALARVLVNRRAALAAATVLALAPLHIWFSQEGRMYAPVLLVVTLSYYALARHVVTLDSRWATAYGWLTLIALYADYSAAYAIAPQVLVIAWFVWARERQAALLVTRGIGAALAFAPWIPTMLQSFATLSYDRSSYHGATPRRVLMSLLGLTGLGGNGSYYVSRAMDTWQRWPALHVPLAVLCVALFAGGLLALWRHGARSLLLVAGLTLGTVTSAILVSLVSPGFAERVIMAALLGWALGLGALAFGERLPRAIRVLGQAGLVVVLLASGVTLSSLYRGAVKQDYRGVVRDAAAVAPLGGAVVTASIMDEFFSAYAPGLRLAPATAIGSADAVWFAYGDYSWANIDQRRRELESAGYQRVMHQYFEDPLYLDLYVRPQLPGTVLLPGLAPFAAAPTDWRRGGGSRPALAGTVLVRGGDPAEPAAFMDFPAQGRRLVFVSFQAQASGDAVPRASVTCRDRDGAADRTSDAATLAAPGNGNTSRLTLAIVCSSTTASVRLSTWSVGPGSVALSRPDVSSAPLAAPGSEPAARTDFGFGTTWRLLVYLVLVSILVFVTLPRRIALGVSAGLVPVTIAVAAPAAARLSSAGLGFANAARSVSTWVALLSVGLALVALPACERWIDRPGPRRWSARAIYVAGIGGLASWWFWSGARDNTLALRYLPDLDRQALSLVPVILTSGSVLQLALSVIVPAEASRRALRRDLLAALALVLVPIAGVTASFRQQTQLDTSAGVSLVAGALGITVALRALVAARLLIEAADVSTISSRRLAMGLFAAVLTLGLSVASWRALVLPPGGDEPQYLAATITLWRFGNLDLPAGVFSAEMNRLVASSPYQRDVHLYDDNTRDRLTMSAPLTRATSLYLPVAGGNGLSATLELLNDDIETAGTKVTFYDPSGREVSVYNVVVEPGQPMLLRSPDSAVLLSAAITAGKPISASLRLSDIRAGDELYGAGRAVPKRCIPVALGADAPNSTLMVQNVLTAPAKVVVRQVDARGTPRTEQELEVPGNGSAATLLTESAGLGAVCIVADGPVASLVLTRGNPGLRVQQADSPRSATFAIPMPEVVQGRPGETAVLLYNPGPAPVQVIYYKDVNGGTAWDGEVVPPGGTARYISAQASRDIAHTTGWVVLDGPMVVNVVSSVGAHTTGVAPRVAPATKLRLPVLGPQTRRYTDSILELSNFGPSPALASVKLVTTQGTVVWQDEVWVCSTCVETRRVWYQNPVDGVLTVESSLPVNATFLQREVVVAWAYHSLGLSLLVLPGYAVAGWGGGVLPSLAIMSALLATSLFYLMGEAGITRRTAVAVTLVATASSPLLTYTSLLYPELAATLFLLVGVRLLLREGVRPTALGLLFLAIVPLIHTRLLPLAIIALFAVILLRVAPSGSGLRNWPWRRLLAWALPSGVALALFVALAWRFEPRTRPDYLQRYFGLDAVGTHFLGLLFDQASGLLPAFPALLFAGAGLYWLIRGRSAAGTASAILALAPLALVALRRDGWELTPPARYLIPATPFLAVGLAAVWDRMGLKLLRTIGVAVVVWGLFATFLFVWLPRGIFLSVDPLRWYGVDLFRALFGFNPFALFPTMPSNPSYAPSGATVAVVVTVLVLATVVPLTVSRWGAPSARRYDRAAVAKPEQSRSGGRPAESRTGGPMSP